MEIYSRTIQQLSVLLPLHLRFKVKSLESEIKSNPLISLIHPVLTPLALTPSCQEIISWTHAVLIGLSNLQ